MKYLPLLLKNMKEYSKNTKKYERIPFSCHLPLLPITGIILCDFC